ncbi:MAG: hypothetical protein JOZ89_00655 [Gammaproteobacteria bacterium]|nr:hypothetical protein [Gammaproteobacteria bacterium]
MRARIEQVVLMSALTLGIGGCGSASGQEPSESEMKAAMLYIMNNPPGTTKPDAPISIKFFKKQACDKPTPQGYNCTFNIETVSSDPGLGWYNNLNAGVFYKDNSGKWQMRPPF